MSNSKHLLKRQIVDELGIELVSNKDNDDYSGLEDYYHPSSTSDNVCDRISEISKEDALKCESRPTMTVLLVITFLLYILIMLTSSKIKKMTSSYQRVVDEEEGLLESENHS